MQGCPRFARIAGRGTWHAGARPPTKRSNTHPQNKMATITGGPDARLRYWFDGGGRGLGTRLGITRIPDFGGRQLELILIREQSYSDRTFCETHKQVRASWRV